MIRLLIMEFSACYCSNVADSGNPESSGEEYQIGEYVLEDLELGSTKEAGSIIVTISFSSLLSDLIFSSI